MVQRTLQLLLHETVARLTASFVTPSRKTFALQKALGFQNHLVLFVDKALWLSCGYATLTCCFDGDSRPRTATVGYPRVLPEKRDLDLQDLNFRWGSDLSPPDKMVILWKNLWIKSLYLLDEHYRWLMITGYNHQIIRHVSEELTKPGGFGQMNQTEQQKRQRASCDSKATCVGSQSFEWFPANEQAIF